MHKKYYAEKQHYTPVISLEQYRTKKVKGNGNIRSFLAFLMLAAVTIFICFWVF
jgi:hypothetical protein